ncbi:MAG: response regulator transcription factor [Actinomycetota bacterium]|jgi:DNA-binding NarL/FixJ family response regulator|nr:response regulator transcription factor [Actinomycetota bacterium]
MNIRVLIVDDQALVRAGFKVLVDSAPDLEVVGEASDGDEAIRLAAETAPDVILMDIRMPRMDGLAATREILAAASSPGPRILVLTTVDIDDYDYEALRAGASGFLLKDTEPAALIDAIRVIAKGDALLSPSITRRLIEEFVKRPENASASSAQFDSLTERELEVLVLVGHGLSNDEIAERLVISPMTAKTHVSRIFMKLGARDRAQLVVMTYEAGLVVPGT